MADCQSCLSLDATVRSFEVKIKVLCCCVVNSQHSGNFYKLQSGSFINYADDYTLNIQGRPGHMVAYSRYQSPFPAVWSWV